MIPRLPLHKFLIRLARRSRLYFHRPKCDVLTPSLKQQRVRKRLPGTSLGLVALALIAGPCLAASGKADRPPAAARPKLALKASASDDGKAGPVRKSGAVSHRTDVADAGGKTSKKPAPGAREIKTTRQLAATTPAAKAASGGKETGRVTVKLAGAMPARKVKPEARPGAGAFVSPVRVKMNLPKAAPVELASVAPAPVMNTAPVPYGLMAARAPAVRAVVMDNVLTPYDVELYQSAFSQIDSGDYAGAEVALGQVSDRSLMGYAEFHKLFSRGYTSTYDELIDWLDRYGDEPMAMNVWNLAKRKKPGGTPDPAFPSLGGHALPVQATQALNADDGAVELAGYTTLDTPVQTAPNAGPGIDDGDGDLTPKSARSAYNNGQLQQAVSLGRKIGDHWVTGLAEWRLGLYDAAETEFKFVSSDPSRNAWSQSSGAYWAGRCALKQGHDADAGTYFKIAASFPFTFYGLLAEARLGVTPAVTLAQKGQAPTYDGGDRTALSASLSDDFSWARGDARAVRLNALVQVGRDSDAQRELQAALQTARDNDERDRWLAVAARTQISVSQLQPADRLFDASIYPMPDYAPAGGFKVDRALVYALARKESKFNSKAVSYSGAYGLLQMMPATAALIEGDPSLASKPAQLLRPAVNLRVGQDYIQRLSNSPIVAGDLLRTIAAYNAGPRPVKDALDSLGGDADSLLVMESIPVAQTRQYVEEVAASYWIYRQIMGKPSKTLAMAAGDARIIAAAADQ